MSSVSFLLSLSLPSVIFLFFFFNDTATTEIYTLSLHDALPICKLSRLAAEAREIQAALRAEGERERAKLVAEAEDLAAKIKVDAGFLAEQEVKIARRQIRAEIARLAQQAAQQVLQRHLTPADQKRLVEEFLTDLGGAR